MTTTAPATAPAVTVPREFNTAAEYIDRPIGAGHGQRIAYICGDERVSYAQLQRRVNQTANALAALGVEMEQRVVVLLPNQPEFVYALFGAMRIGVVAAAMSTAIQPAEQALLLADSRARAIVVSEALWAPLRSRRAEFPLLKHVFVVGNTAPAPGEHDFAALVEAASPECATAPTTADDVALWLHTSGSTGTPKWAVHLHRNLPHAEQLYAAPFIGLRPGDVLLAGPCFHAYPLGLATYFALRAGATVVLNRERSTPARMFELIAQQQVTVFAGVPTLYAQMLQAAEGRSLALPSVRICLSAAEPLPAEIHRRWQERFGVEILDGIGTTEALHVFISNRAGESRPGSSGRAVPGYDVRLLDEQGNEVADGEIGNLVIRGGSLFAGYWNQIDTSRRVLQGQWYHTGDKYLRDADGFYYYSGRADDMLRVSGHWVSPAEVEAALIAHPAVVEAAVVGKADADELIKPQAFVILREGVAPSEALAEELKVHVKATIAPYNYPRWIEFVADLPKTATGKIQRFKLRAPAS
ncbi:MAG TPA: benzoate-CoA ligase family protein [Dehalococcoidia bacterium]|nr:benzoate-CoA ligase family protein [Dehalococcoidia bacterium]